jgi:methyltransferase (TIGR00027 family)
MELGYRGRGVKPGQVSVTAQRVAAHRLTFDRVTAPYGDPAADTALARDVAAATNVRPGPMREYLRARTRFFDDVVTRALSGGIAQIVTGAAGYDGRSLRYARPGVLWFEVDHPATQRDKRSRLDRLGIDGGHLRFVAADFTVDPVADLLASAGLDPGRPSLFLLEGIAVYLEEPVLRSLLAQLRQVAADGSRLAISLSVSGGSPERTARRAAFQAAVAAMGEPARSAVAGADTGTLLEATGWRPVGQPTEPGSAARRSAGFLLAAPAKP